MLTSRGKDPVFGIRRGSFSLTYVSECWVDNRWQGAKTKDKEVPSTPYSEYWRPGIASRLY